MHFIITNKKKQLPDSYEKLNEDMKVLEVEMKKLQHSADVGAMDLVKLAELQAMFVPFRKRYEALEKVRKEALRKERRKAYKKYRGT